MHSADMAAAATTVVFSLLNPSSQISTTSLIQARKDFAGARTTNNPNIQLHEECLEKKLLEASDGFSVSFFLLTLS